MALVQFLMASGRRAEAETAVAAAEKTFTPAQNAAALVTCYELVNRPEKVQETFRKALDASTNDPAALRRLAVYLLTRQRFQEAEPFLDRLTKLADRAPADADWARNILALLLSSSGDEQRAQRARELLASSESTSPPIRWPSSGSAPASWPSSLATARASRPSRSLRISGNATRKAATTSGSSPASTRTAATGTRPTPCSAT